MKIDKLLLEIASITRGRISKPQTLADFLEYCALITSARTDPVHMKQRLESLKELTAQYRDGELQRFNQGFVDLCNTFSHNIQQELYEDLFALPFTQIGATNKELKQSFSPDDIAKLMANIIFPPQLSVSEKGFITLNDCTCGCGSLLLAGIQHYANAGYNPTKQLTIEAADLDVRCVHMAYLQFSFYGIPAVVVHGNEITLHEYDRWYTPVYLSKKWIWRAQMRFGESGYISDEKLKCFDEPLYGALKCLDRKLSVVDKDSTTDEPKTI